jgi:glycosyltransferase involved in cell wall biosynthesis
MAVGARPGVGGLGAHVAFALGALGRVVDVEVAGPPERATVPRVSWHSPSLPIPDWVRRYTWLRWQPGLMQAQTEKTIARLAARVLSLGGAAGCYAFTHVALEALEYCQAHGIPSVVDSPNGHIRNLRRLLEQESAVLLGRNYIGPPTLEMVERVEHEYAIADSIRVSSGWAKKSLVSHGIAAHKIWISDLGIDLWRFLPGPVRLRSGPLRICYVGSIDLRKGVVYLLRALQPLGRQTSLRLVGATGSRSFARLIEHEGSGLDIQLKPGDPRSVYQNAELLVLPSLEDGFGYVVAEAMASGLPVVVTDQCGAAEWVTPGKDGWIVPPASAESLTAVFSEAIANRGHLEGMGLAARAAIVRRMQEAPDQALSERLSGVFSGKAP